MAEEQWAVPTGPTVIHWWRILLGTLLAFSVGIIVMVLTGNPVLFPTVLMLGTFAVPSSYVAFFYDRRHLSKLTLPDIVMSFFYGGILGVFASALLEPLFIGRQNPASALVVGLIEEFAKVLGVLVIARHHRHNVELDGLILGAAAGMGFASMESNGYGFVTFLASGGSLSLMLAVTLLRGILSPLGHGTWTAILVSVLFRESAIGRFRINYRVIGAYLTVSVLHGLWDGLPPVISVLFSPGIDVFIGQAVVASIGLVILRRRWTEAKRLQLERSAEQA